jgi:hypothetical protein
MKTTQSILAASLLLIGSGAVSAQARYLCDAPPTPLDARACAAAQQGPAQLRQFVQRMQSIQNLHFADYVDEATAVAWDAQTQKVRRPAGEEHTLAARQQARESR